MTRTPRRTARTVAVLASLTTLAALAGCGDGASSASDPASSAPASASDGAEAVSCDYVVGGPAAREVDPPPEQVSVADEEPVSIETTQGTIGATLDGADAPCTVGSFLSLADQGYFDGTPCHRLTTSGIFVLQCGDPTGTGTGGPGYSFADELTGEETYPAGTLAMANAGPDTNGSQFFVVYEDTDLPPSYTVFGTIDEEGLATVQQVAEAGVEGGAPDGPPATPVEITAVTRG